jgi:hypothetical protein
VVRLQKASTKACLKALMYLQVLKSTKEQASRDYLVILHVLQDTVFKSVFAKSSQAEMALFRGMFLSVELTKPIHAHCHDGTASTSDSESSGTFSTESEVSTASSRTSLRDKDAPALKSVTIQQAFLPKFENEAQDQQIANQIVAQAGSHYMVATVKHSGSLNTLSHNLMGAKNSINNEYTAAGILLLHAHYRRLSDLTCDLLNLSALTSLSAEQ